MLIEKKLKINQCAQYIVIILFSFFVISSGMFSRQSASTESPSLLLSTKTNLSNTVIESGPQKNVVVSGNNVYVVWMDRTTTSGTEDILFRKSTDGGNTFDKTIDISKNPGNSIFPQIAVSGNNVYVVWQDNTPSPPSLLCGSENILFNKSTDGGNTFSSTNMCLSHTGDASEPQIVVSGNNVYVVWSNALSSTASEILFSKSTDGGNNFSIPFDISQILKKSFSPQIAISGSNVYVVWADDTNVNGKSDIFFRKSIDGGNNFGNTLNLSKNLGNSSEPQIAASGNNVYVVWTDETTINGKSDIFFRKSTDGGNTFTFMNLSKNPGGSFSPQIVVSDNVYVVWADATTTFGTEDILFRKSTDGGNTFDKTIDISNNLGDSSEPQIAVFEKKPYVVWTDDTTAFGTDDIFFSNSTDGGNNFSIPLNLSKNPGGSISPQIAVPGSNVYVVWADETTVNGNSDIFFKKNNATTLNLSNTTQPSASPQIDVS